MRLEAVQIEAVVAQLRGWGYKISTSDEEDLVEEFNIRNGKHDLEDDPGKKKLGLFHKRGSETARKAALDNYPRSGTQRLEVLLAVAAAGEDGATSDEISTQYNIRLYSVKPRMFELRQGKWLMINGTTRPSDTGSAVDVHYLTDKARKWIREKEGMDV